MWQFWEYCTGDRHLNMVTYTFGKWNVSGRRESFVDDLGILDHFLFLVLMLFEFVANEEKIIEKDNCRFERSSFSLLISKDGRVFWKENIFPLNLRQHVEFHLFGLILEDSVPCMCVTFMYLLLVFIYIEVQTSQFHFSVILTQLL